MPSAARQTLEHQRAVDLGTQHVGDLAVGQLGRSAPR